MRKIVLALVSLAALAALSCSLEPAAPVEVAADELEARAASASTLGDYVPGELLVKFAPGTSAEARGAAIRAAKGAVDRTILSAAMKRFGDDEGIVVLKVPMNALEAAGIVKKLEGVVFAEPNWIYAHAAVSNDPYYTGGQLWGMYGDGTSPANQYGSQAGEAWARGNVGSKTVHIGVIDEGAMWAHTDLSGQIWTNPYDPVDGKDNDGNGYIDDVHGWDFAAGDNTTYDGASDDHGTHVSGTIGAIGGNALGVVGVSWNVTIITAKFLGQTGGTTENAILAVDYLTDLKLRHGLALPATNNSWGGGAFSQGLQDAIERANAADILFVAAAGNESLDIDSTISYPAGYPNANIVAVAAIDSAGNLASYSNYGATRVDLGAPGSAVYSTVPSKNGRTSSYASYSGTSMATPHVTGAVALYAATHPTATAAQIKAALLGSVVPTASLAGKCVTGGRLNASGF
ncbi:MAG: S8 family serine peptidase [Spirochaetia bacterium]|nr:S8 family serine peptidase [Spirochaetia bacterium]